MKQEKVIINHKNRWCFEGNYIKYEGNWDKDEKLSIEEYLDMIRSYLGKIIDDHNENWKSN